MSTTETTEGTSIPTNRGPAWRVRSHGEFTSSKRGTSTFSVSSGRFSCGPVVLFRFDLRPASRIGGFDSPSSIRRCEGPWTREPKQRPTTTVALAGFRFGEKLNSSGHSRYAVRSRALIGNRRSCPRSTTGRPDADSRIEAAVGGPPDFHRSDPWRLAGRRKAIREMRPRTAREAKSTIHYYE